MPRILVVSSIIYLDIRDTLAENKVSNLRIQYYVRFWCKCTLGAHVFFSDCGLQGRVALRSLGDLYLDTTLFCLEPLTETRGRRVHSGGCSRQQRNWARLPKVGRGRKLARHRQCYVLKANLRRW